MDIRTAPQVYKYNKVHPFLEIIRAKIITKFCIRFNKICGNISRSKSDDFVIRFCWRNIGTYDPVVPLVDKYNYDQLTTDLENYKFDAQRIIKELNAEHFFKRKYKKLKK